MGRRAFLRRSATVSAALGATALVGTAAGPATTATAADAHTEARHWAALAATLTGSLVLPADLAYPDSVLLYNEVFTSRPAAVAYCATAADVQRCVAFARDHRVPLVARSGGHSYGGYSSGPGLVVDVSPLNAVSLESGRPESGRPFATVGAGAQLIDVYSVLGASGVLLPGGSCPTVGIAGLALGGGIGVFGRAYGMTCDNIASLRVVTAEGSLRRCSPDSHSDLYWASRGGGGGNFGIVTSLTFAVHPMPDVNLFTLEWPFREAPAVVDSFLRWIPATPNELWANLQLDSDGTADGGGILKVTGVFAGSTAACASALAPLLRVVGAAPTYQFVGPEDYLRAMLIEAGCEGLTVGQCHLPTRNRGGTLSRSAYAAKSSFIDAALPSTAIEALIDAVQALGSDVPGVGGGIVFDSYGGVINERAPGETAFVHRSAIACAQYSVTYASASPPPPVATAARDWLERVQAALAPYASGAYQNYIDPTLPDWAEAYYGTNLPRLRRVKGTYDSDDVFHFAQSIPLPARTIDGA